MTGKKLLRRTPAPEPPAPSVPDHLKGIPPAPDEDQPPRPDPLATPPGKRRVVPRDQRKSGWPKLHPGLHGTTGYLLYGMKLVGLSTNCETFELGWTECGGCRRYFRRCRCPQGVSPSRGTVICWRKGNGLEVNAEPVKRNQPFRDLYDKDEAVATQIKRVDPSGSIDLLRSSAGQVQPARVTRPATKATPGRKRLTRRTPEPAPVAESAPVTRVLRRRVIQPPPVAPAVPVKRLRKKP